MFKIFIKVILFAFLLILGSLLFLLTFKSITVTYQRTTGPDFIVNSGESFLMLKYNNQKDLIYSEVFVDLELDTDIGYPKDMKYVIVGRDFLIKQTNFNSYPLIGVWLIFSKIEVLIFRCIFVIVIFFLLSQFYTFKRSPSNARRIN